MQADYLRKAKSFRVGEEVQAFWARDGRYYPAQVREVVDGYRVKVQFTNLEKAFEMLTTQVRKIFRKRPLPISAERFHRENFVKQRTMQTPKRFILAKTTAALNKNQKIGN